MKLIIFCNECRERIGGHKIAFLETLTMFYEIFQIPSFLSINESEASINAQRVAKELEEMGYLVTHEDGEGDLAMFPKDISPKVCGCHLYCKNKEEKNEVT